MKCKKRLPAAVLKCSFALFSLVKIETEKRDIESQDCFSGQLEKGVLCSFHLHIITL